VGDVCEEPADNCRSHINSNNCGSALFWGRCGVGAVIGALRNSVQFGGLLSGINLLCSLVIRRYIVAVSCYYSYAYRSMLVAPYAM
jgi:hypothetical protein